jgi:hypothetical protein
VPDIDNIATIPFGVAVIDESHNIKNPSALITRAVNQLNAVTRVALSGTPVMNNTFDLYAQLSFLLPGMFGSRDFFKREYADAIDRDQDPDKIKALQKLTGTFYSSAHQGTGSNGPARKDSKALCGAKWVRSKNWPTTPSKKMYATVSSLT